MTTRNWKIVPGRLGPPIFALAGVLLVQLSSCASVEPLERPYRVAVPMPPQVAERFDYQAGEVHAELSLLRENTTYRGQR